MGYEVAQPLAQRAKRPAIPDDGIVVSTVAAPRNGELYARFEIGPAAAHRLGWAAGDHLQLAWGQGPDFGKLRLRRLAQGRGFELRQRKRGHLAITVSARLLPDDFADKRLTRLRCPHEAIAPTAAHEDAVSVYLTLPRGFLERVS